MTKNSGYSILYPEMYKGENMKFTDFNSDDKVIIQLILDDIIEEARTRKLKDMVKSAKKLQSKFDQNASYVNLNNSELGGLVGLLTQAYDYAAKFKKEQDEKKEEGVDFVIFDENMKKIGATKEKVEKLYEAN